MAKPREARVIEKFDRISATTGCRSLLVRLSFRLLRFGFSRRIATPGPRIAKRHDAVKYKLLRGAVDGVLPEVAEALELVSGIRLITQHTRLDKAFADGERCLVEMIGERRLGRIGVRHFEQTVVPPELSRHTLAGRHPVPRPTPLSAILRGATARCRVIARQHLDHVAGIILDDIVARDEIRVAQPNLTSRSKPVEPRNGFLHKVAPLDI